jgi:ATP synthase protein I
MEGPGPDESEADAAFQRAVTRKERRKLRARARPDRTPWFWLGMFGLVGWSVAIPTVLGIVLGVYLDRRWPSDTISWTLTMLFAGAFFGCLTAWYWIRQESPSEDED